MSEMSELVKIYGHAEIRSRNAVPLLFLPLAPMQIPPAEPPSTIEYCMFYRCLLLDVELLLLGKGGGEEEMRQKKAKQELDYWFVTLQI